MGGTAKNLDGAILVVGGLALLLFLFFVVYGLWRAWKYLRSGHD